MVGHATRVAQGDLDELADRDDRALVRYLVASRAVDRAAWRLGVLVPLGWPVLAAAGLAPNLLYSSPSAGAIAIPSRWPTINSPGGHGSGFPLLDSISRFA